MKFVSKRDWWVSVLMMLISIYSIGMTFLNEMKIIYRVMLLLFAILVLWILYGTFYILSKDFLILRCGPLKVKISYKNIDSIMPTKNLISSIALSTDKLRLNISGKGIGVIYISPLFKEEFIKQLSKKCPGLKILSE